MKYYGPLDKPNDPDAPYINADPANGQEGSKVPAGAIEAPQREILAVIQGAGLSPDETDNAQLLQAIDKKIGDIPSPELVFATEIEGGKGYVATLTEAKAGATDASRTGDPAWVTPEGVKAAIEVFTRLPYELCEFYYFRHPTLRPGFQPAQGGLILNAATLYPEAWAYLQTIEGQLLCTSEANWQAMTTTIFHTNADGTTIGWDGIGGAPYFVQNLVAGTLRMPDLRGMYAEAAGFDSLGVGGVHSDGVRNTAGAFSAGWSNHPSWQDGPFEHTFGEAGVGHMRTAENPTGKTTFDPSRVVPIANQNQPRAWGALACFYLGAPK